MEFRDHAGKESSALIARLFSESAENSRQRLAAFRTAINNTTKALESALVSTPHFEREVTELVARLSKAASAEADAAAERAAAEGRAAADAIRAELKAETKQKDAIAATLNDARAKVESLDAKLKALGAELEAEKQRSDTARREVTDAREALKKVEAARVEAAAERDKEAKTRATLETELQRLRQAIDTARAEAASTSDQLEAAIAEKARLEEALATAQSQVEATEAKLAGVTALFKQSSAKLKTLEKEQEVALQDLETAHAAALAEIEATHAAAIREMEAAHSAVVRQMEATHAAVVRDMEASRHAAIDEALQEAARNHEAEIRDLEAIQSAALRELEAKHAVEMHQLEAEHVSAARDAEHKAAREAEHRAAREAEQRAAREAEQRFAEKLREIESRHTEEVRELEAQLHASATAGSESASAVVSRVDDLLEGFQALSGASSVADVLATVVEHLAAEFSRVALFYVRGNRLEGSNQIGFEFDNDIAKLVFPLGLDSLLTRAVVSGRIERVTGDEIPASGLTAFGGSPTCALAMPVVVQGETLAILYADDSGRSTTELSTRFARALLQHAVALLMRQTSELRQLAELRGYATSLLAEVEEMYAADAASGKSGEDLQYRLKNNIDFARSIFATRIESEGIANAAPVFEDQLASLLDAQAETRFGRDLATLIGRDEHHAAHRKAEAS